MCGHRDAHVPVLVTLLTSLEGAESTPDLLEIRGRPWVAQVLVRLVDCGDVRLERVDVHSALELQVRQVFDHRPALHRQRALRLVVVHPRQCAPAEVVKSGPLGGVGFLGGRDSSKWFISAVRLLRTNSMVPVLNAPEMDVTICKDKSAEYVPCIVQWLNFEETKIPSTWTVLGRNDKIMIRIKRNGEMLNPTRKLPLTIKMI